MIVVLGLVPMHAWAGPRRQAPPPQAEPGEPPAVSPAELQRMFDAYALMRAQDALQIRDEQYAAFLARFKALQDVRRQDIVERNRILGDLRRLLQASPADEGRLRERMKALQDVTARTAGDLRRAYDAIDQVLDAPQQARFRLFEEQMERRKIELLMRAQNNRNALPKR